MSRILATIVLPHLSEVLASIVILVRALEVSPGIPIHVDDALVERGGLLKRPIPDDRTAPGYHDVGGVASLRDDLELDVLYWLWLPVCILQVWDRW